jgi:membrane associated rhomboid family serine protease
MTILKEEKIFPVVTFFLAFTTLVTFLLTFKNLAYFESSYGFKILIFPTVTDTSSLVQFLKVALHFFVTLITYTFIHADLLHLIGNMVILIIAGLAVEEKLGRGLFLSTYIFSGVIAAMFDMIGRVSLGISFSVPFIGSSGAIFGVMAIAGLVKPMEKIPTVLVLLTFLPLVYLIPNLDVFSDMVTLTVILIFSIALIIFIIPTFPSYIPLIVAIIIYLSSWLIGFLIKYPLTVSNIGHLGGMVGGIVSFFIFTRGNTV